MENNRTIETLQAAREGLLREGNEKIKEGEGLLKKAEGLMFAIETLKSMSSSDASINYSGILNIPKLSPINEYNESLKDGVYSIRDKYKDVKGTVIEKVIAIIKAEGRFLSRFQIELVATKIRKPFSGLIASTLSAAKNDINSELASHGVGNKMKWGLKSWLDADGNIVDPIYEYVEDIE